MNSQLMNDFAQLLQQTTPQQREQLSSMLSNIVITINNENVKKFTKKILQNENNKKIYFKQFIESTEINGLITAPTQVGKSNATREFIETCFEQGVPVIVSTDNKSDQNEQLFHRIERDLAGADVRMLKVIDKSFGDDLKECIKTEFHRFVIFALDNSAQVEKLIVNLTSLSTRHSREMHNIKKIAIIHDEADQVTKDKDTEHISPEQAESHKKWLELVYLFKHTMSYIDLKRIFITATPDNVVMLYKIHSASVMCLEIPAGYVGYKNIECIPFEDDFQVKDILSKEVSRIKAAGTFEAILYCIERKIVDGHEKVLDSLASTFKCAINTYNGNGITAYLRTVAMSKTFESLCKKNNIKYTRDGKFFVIKNLAIRTFYTMCKKVGENCVITIGKDLISRGISYVGEDKTEPITATTMIYKPGTKLHCVGLCQTIGRITGCAMPQYARRLYAPQSVIDAYIGYNKNVEAYISKMGATGGTDNCEIKSTKEIIDGMEFQKTGRDIDRRKLGLKMNVKDDAPEKNDGGDNISRMKQLIDLWWGADTIIGKILKYVYEHENGVSESQLKAFITNIGGIFRTWYTDLHTQNKDYTFVFERNSQRITRLKSSAIEYIRTLPK